MLIEWLLQCSASMLSGYLSCMFRAKMRKMEQAGGDGVCIHICWSSRQPGRPTGRSCSVGTSLPSPGTFSHLWSPPSTLGPPAVIPPLLCILSFLSWTLLFAPWTCRSPWKQQRVHAVCYVPPMSHLLCCHLPLRARDNMPNTIITSRRNASTSFHRQAERLWDCLPRGAQTDVLCYLQKHVTNATTHTLTKATSAQTCNIQTINSSEKSKSVILQKRDEWFCKAMTSFFCGLGSMNCLICSKG